MSLAQFSQTLAETPASVFIQSVSWIIPSLQTVHILAISVVLGSILLVDLRLLGLVGRGVALDAVVRRFAAWLWWSLLVLAITGSVLVVGEPDRSLTNPVFQTKLVLVALAALATLAITRPVAGDPQFWTATPARLAAGRGLALVSLAIWLAVIIAGRWIAYAI
ncbi:MAG TPA: DUF6644 family protein [Phenylobacterium sp.]|uniref:DUF6644 family protein n=1 Tax=Phenylobacterium sp. TaxID=1871053 RepID=UPI002B466E72|nr:DUF6644 family protein [Phenylobacterium sp.]HKR89926.1 DUF6644 family protein [Phenylobacterium sp.]